MDLFADDNELNQLREDMEKGWQTLNETVMEGINEMDEIMNETLMATNGVNDRMEEINRTLHSEINLLNEAINTKVERLNKIGESRERAINEMNNTIQSMDRNIQRELRELGEQMEDEINYKMNVINQTIYREMDEMNAKRMNDTQHVMEKLDVVQNATAVHHQWPGESTRCCPNTHTLHYVLQTPVLKISPFPPQTRLTFTSVTTAVTSPSATAIKVQEHTDPKKI